MDKQNAIEVRNVNKDFKIEYDIIIFRGCD